VVITDCDHDTIAPEQAVLSDPRVQLRLASCKTGQDIIDQASDAHVLINQYAPVTGEVLDALPHCRLVVRYGVGVDNVDVPAATKRGVWVANVPDYGSDEVADHTVALAFSLLRGVVRLNGSVRRGAWAYAAARPLRRLSTLTFGVVGCGAIGTAVARRAAALGMRVIGTDLDPSRTLAADTPIENVSFDELLATADVLSLHANLTEASHHLIGRQALNAMKPTAYLLNTARGGLVDSVALLDALNRDALAGAALDVLETEPPDDTGRALAVHDRVILTPHAAWYSEESFVTLKNEVAHEALRVLRGERPRCPVNNPAEAQR
ncbi:C-terminal binding protein, partial [Streptomyces sp. NEAU-Y11]